MSRQRTRFSTVPTRFYSFNYRGQAFTGSTSPSLLHYRSMTDESGPAGRDKYCTSVEREFEYYGAMEVQQPITSTSFRALEKGFASGYPSSPYWDAQKGCYSHLYHLVTPPQFTSEEVNKLILSALPSYNKDDESVLYLLRDLTGLGGLLRGLKTGLLGLLPGVVPKSKILHKRNLFLEECRKQNLTGGKSFLKRFSKDYLAYSFGVLPFISDLKQASELVDRAGYYSTLPVGKTRLVNRKLLTKRASDVILNDNENCVKVTYSQCTARIGVNVKYVYNNDDPKSLSSDLKRTATILGLHRVFSQIWDMIPFSFMVDWVLPVGDLLAYAENNFGFYPKYEIISATQHLLTVIDGKRKHSSHLCSMSNKYTIIKNTYPFDMSIRERTYTRIPLPDISNISKDYLKLSQGLNVRRTSYVMAIALSK